MFTTKKLKLINKFIVADAIKNMDFATKSEISKITGLSVAACGYILNELVHEKEVNECDLHESTGGRRAKKYIYNNDCYHFLSLFVSIDENGIKIVYCISNALGDSIFREEKIITCISIVFLIDYISEIIERFEKIKAIGIGFPGVIVNGVIQTCDIIEFNNFSVEKILSEKFGMPVFSGNDMNYIVLGFSNNLMDNVLYPISYLFLPKRHKPGCGLCINGFVVEGFSNFAGELSNISFYDQQQMIVAVNADDKKFIIDMIVNLINAIVVVINPGVIALSGELICEEWINEIHKKCGNKIPLQHVPKLNYREDTTTDYLVGIKKSVLEKVNQLKQMDRFKF